MSASGDARSLFREITGHEPDGEWSAPGRVNLIGEHTDYNDGFVLPFAIDQRTAVVVGRRDDRRIRVASRFDPEPVEVALDELDTLFPTSTGGEPAVTEWAAYPLGVAWALLDGARAAGGESGGGESGGARRAGGEDPAAVTGLDIAIASDVPVGAGLSSSAAIESATASALNDLWSLGLDDVALARVGRRAENDAVGAPTGIMDQMASMLGEPDSAIFLDCRSLHTQLVDLGFADAGLDLVVIDTRVKHSHATGGYGDRRAACERGAEALGVTALRDLAEEDLPRAAELLDEETYRRVRHVVTEDARVIETVRTLRADGPRAIGPLLLASHASMRDDFEISVPELDLAVESAMAAGAVGARMTGGGFGGAAIALVAHDEVREVAAAVTAAFAAAGFDPPAVFVVTPSAGARRDD